MIVKCKMCSKEMDLNFTNNTAGRPRIYCEVCKFVSNKENQKKYRATRKKNKISSTTIGDEHYGN